MKNNFSKNGIEAIKNQRGIAFSVPDGNLEAAVYCNINGNADVQGIVFSIITYLSATTEKNRIDVTNVILNSAMAILKANPKHKQMFLKGL